jgi:hypothetical protein
MCDRGGKINPTKQFVECKMCERGGWGDHFMGETSKSEMCEQWRKRVDGLAVCSSEAEVSDSHREKVNWLIKWTNENEMGDCRNRWRQRYGRFGGRELFDLLSNLWNSWGERRDIVNACKWAWRVKFKIRFTHKEFRLPREKINWWTLVAKQTNLKVAFLERCTLAISEVSWDTTDSFNKSFPPKNWHSCRSKIYFMLLLFDKVTS